MNKIISIVDNSINRDSRVRKQAFAVSAALECDFSIYGIVDEYEPLASSFLDGKVKMRRLPMKSLKYFIPQLVASTYLFFFFFCFLIACALFAYYFFFQSVFVLILGIVILTLRYFKKVSLTNFLLFFLPKQARDDLRNICLIQLKSLQLSIVFYPFLKEEIPSIIHAHDVPMLTVASYFKRKHDVKIIFDSHELFEHMYGRGWLFQFYFKRYIAKLILNIDGFITVNDSILKYYLDNYKGFKSGVVVKNAISSSEFRSHSKSQVLRRELGISNDKKILLYQGGITPPRGLESLIDASRFISGEWVIVLMGWGSHLQALVQLSQRIGSYRKNVFFLDPVRNDVLIDWTSGADVGIIPYLNNCLNHYYCTPNKLWEFPVAGVPILAPDYPELGKIVKTYDIGWTVDRMSGERIAELLNSLSIEEIKAKINNIPAFLEVEGWSTYEKKLLRLYSSLMEN